jgi:hypothetical protein
MINPFGSVENFCWVTFVHAQKKAYCFCSPAIYYMLYCDSQFHVFSNAGINIFGMGRSSCLYTHTHTHTHTKVFNILHILWVRRAVQPSGSESVPAHMYSERSAAKIIKEYFHKDEILKFCSGSIFMFVMTGFV